MTLRQNDGVAMTEQQLDVHASMELSDAQMEGVAGNIGPVSKTGRHTHSTQFSIGCDYSDGFKVRCPDDRNH